MNARRSACSREKIALHTVEKQQMWQYRSPWSPRASSLRWTQIKLRNLTSTLYASSPNAMRRSANNTLNSAQTARERDQVIAHRELKAKQLKIDQLTHEMAILKRYRFDRHSEQLDVMQRSLLDESIDADIEAISLEIEALKKSRLAAEGQAAPRGAAGILPAPRDPHEPEKPTAAAAAAWSASARM
jgi:transposase